MTKRVLKWSVLVDDQRHPIGAGQVVLVACQVHPGEVQVWTEEFDDSNDRTVWAQVYGTGHDVPDDLWHVGSTLAERLVWHVYAGDDA